MNYFNSWCLQKLSFLSHKLDPKLKVTLEGAICGSDVYGAMLSCVSELLWLPTASAVRAQTGAEGTELVCQAAERKMIGWRCSLAYLRSLCGQSLLQPSLPLLVSLAFAPCQLANTACTHVYSYISVHMLRKY